MPHAPSGARAPHPVETEGGMQDGPPAPEGARPVGRMNDASPIAQTVIWSIRAWLEDGEGPDSVRGALCDALGDRDGASAALLLEGYFLALARHHARPLERHALNCPCIGADEALLARVVEYAALNHLAAATAEAAAFIRPSGVAALLAAAAPLGRALLRMRTAPSTDASARLASPTSAPWPAAGATRSLSIH